jgi:hypothetical protein
MVKWIAALLVLTASAAAFLYHRDQGNVHKARDVMAAVHDFCLRRGRLPKPDEFATAHRPLTPETGWYYWPSSDGREVRIRYPMTAKWIADAPGKPEISEFTATTYAYTMHISCPT